MMAIADVFDALSAADRPYKRAVPIARALRILELAAADGEEFNRIWFALFIDRARLQSVADRTLRLLSPAITCVAGPRVSAEPALEAVASVRADFILTPVARVLPGLTSQRLRDARSKWALPPARLQTDAHRAAPSRPCTGNPRECGD